MQILEKVLGPLARRERSAPNVYCEVLGVGAAADVLVVASAELTSAKGSNAQQLLARDLGHQGGEIRKAMFMPKECDIIPLLKQAGLRKLLVQLAH
eukprot:454674-Pelagomonas_calceolata.AAC.1